MDAAETTLSFLFTDIEGSTSLWERHPEAMRAGLARHDAILRAAIEGERGRVFKTVGDAFYAAFPTAGGAIAAALAAQRALARERWDELGELRVRMAIHTGTVEARDGDYFGRPLNRVARILGLAHGGQALVSEVAGTFAAGDLPEGVWLKDLGMHRLRGVDGSERLAQVCHPELRADFPALPTQESPTNLPRQLTRFLGRDEAVSEIEAILREARLVTLTGAGGTGKTRLAIQIGDAARGRFRDGVWLVEFAGIRGGGSVASEVASVLGIRESPGAALEASLLTGLAARRALLILDNCEHVLDDVAPLVASLLRGCPELRILATSRELLGVVGEQTYRVPSLSTPEKERSHSPESLAGYESVRLFVDRAMAAQPSFALTAANAGAVAQVCRDLDGVPLALELAAARVRALPVEKVAERLGDRFRLLTSGARTADPRQQTLRGLIDWSYDLLSPTEQSMLRTLPAFAGGWDLEAIETVAPGANAEIETWQALDHLQSLVDKSLVIYDEATGRYRLLETVRQYAWERAGERGELTMLRTVHARWYVDWAVDRAPLLEGPRQLEAADAFEAEHDNLRAAHGFLVETRQVDAAQRLVAAMAPFWEYRGFLTEGATRGLEALTLGLGPLRLSALIGTGRLLVLHADRAAVEILEEALELARQSRERRAEANAEHAMGNWVFYARDHTEARRRFGIARAIREEIGDRAGVASSSHSLGNVALREGALDEAEAEFMAALSVRRELGDVRGITLTTGALSQLAMARGDLSEVERLTREVAQRLSDLRIRWALALCLSSLIQVAEARGDFERMAELAGARQRVRETTGFPVPEVERDDEAATLSDLRRRIGAEVYDAAFAAGAALGWEEAVAVALGRNSSPASIMGV